MLDKKQDKDQDQWIGLKSCGTHNYRTLKPDLDLFHIISSTLIQYEHLTIYHTQFQINKHITHLISVIKYF